MTRAAPLLRRVAHLAALGAAMAGAAACQAESGSATAARSVEAHVAAQRRLFAELAEDDRRRSPERMSSDGDLRSNRLLDDRSAKARNAKSRRDEAFRRRLAAIPTAGMADEDLIDHDLALRLLDRRLAGSRLRLDELRPWADGGVADELARLPDRMPFDSLRHYLDYADRLDAIPRAIAQSMAMLRRARADGLMPPRREVAGLADAVDGIADADPFRRPLAAMPAGFDAADRARVERAVSRAIEKRALPALRRFASYLRRDYIPGARESFAEGTLPNGATIYRQDIADQTDSGMTPAEIHALGISEVDRIERELEQVARRAGAPSLSAYRATLAADPRYRATSAEQIVDDVRTHVDRIRPLLPALLAHVPPTPLRVEAMGPDDRPNVTHHVDGSPDGRVPGLILVATSDPTRRSLLGDETAAHHEGLPGHELQVAIAHGIVGLPAFRRDSRSSAFVEGWAVYAEALGREAGLPEDPASEYGRLNTELLRAMRLVVDTGLHSEGWTPERAASYLRLSGAVDEPTIAAEVDRCERWPAQGLAYKVGQLRMLELRRRAEARLGTRFDVRAFHDAVLGSGPIPLDLLAAKIDRWIARLAAPGA